MLGRRRRDGWMEECQNGMESSSQWWPGCPGLNSSPGAFRTNFPQERLEQGWHLQPTADQEQITCIWATAPTRASAVWGLGAQPLAAAKKGLAWQLGRPLSIAQAQEQERKKFKNVSQERRGSFPPATTQPPHVFVSTMRLAAAGSGHANARNIRPVCPASAMESENNIVGNAGVFVHAARHSAATPRARLTL